MDAQDYFLLLEAVRFVGGEEPGNLGYLEAHIRAIDGWASTTRTNIIDKLESFNDAARGLSSLLNAEREYVDNHHSAGDYT